MLSNRLAAAVRMGAQIPAGSSQVLYPPVGADLTALESPVVVTSDRLVAEFFEAQGARVVQEPEEVATTVVCLPRSRDFGQQLVGTANALSSELVMVDGQRTDGVDAMLRHIRRATGDVAQLSKSHGRIIWTAPREELKAWRDITVKSPEGYFTCAGIFSAEKIDTGSQTLADALPQLTGRVADLGAGWGYLSSRLMDQEGIVDLHLIDSDARALSCAAQNVQDPRAQFHWADALTWKPESKLDHVVMNPPFHSGRRDDISLGQGFIASAARILGPKGQLWMVANRHLPYEETLASNFHTVEELQTTAAFKLFRAQRPRS